MSQHSRDSIHTTKFSFTIVTAVIGAIAISQATPEKSYAQTQPDQNIPNVQKPQIPALKSYIGIGGTIGLSGSTSALGTSGFSILSKTTLTDLLAIHGNTIVFGSATAASTNALTLNFAIRDDSQEIIVSPFFGAGILTRNDGAFFIDPLLVGGFDIPIGKTFTGTFRIQAGFPNTGKADLGLSAGIGYNF
jgi:hypothetical protein